MALLDRGEPDDDVRDALREPERAALPGALAGVRSDLRSARAIGARAQEYLMEQIAGFVKLTGGGWHPGQRQEFIEQALVELVDYPAAMVDAAIAVARKKVHQPSRFVSWIVETIEPEAIKLQEEERRLARLAEIVA